MLNKIFKLTLLTVLVGMLTACTGGTPQTPYDALKGALNVINSVGHGRGSASTSTYTGERSPLIHKDIYARSNKDKLIYFYQGRDQHSVNFAKTLKEYTDKSWLQIDAYTLDHHSLMEFPNSKHASPEIITKYFGRENSGFKTPVLFLEQYDAHTVQVSVGEVTFMQLISRMNRIAEQRERR